MDIRYIAIVVAFLLAFGCSSQSGASAPAVNGTGNITATGNLGECLASCRGIPSAKMLDGCRIGCYMVEAKSSGDPAGCDPIRGYENASMYYSSCLGNVAGIRGNASLCDRSRNLTEKEWCLLTSAERIKDPSICEPINDSVIKGACIDSAKATLP